MVDITKIGGYVIRENGDGIHVQLPSGRVAAIEGSDYIAAFHNQVYAAMNVGASVAVNALNTFLERKGIRIV